MQIFYFYLFFCRKFTQNLPSETSVMNGDENNLFLSVAASQGNKGLGFGLDASAGPFSGGGFSSWASKANGENGLKSENLFAAFTKPSTVFPKGFEFSVERFPEKNTLSVTDSPRLGSSEACKNLTWKPDSNQRLFSNTLPSTESKPAPILSAVSTVAVDIKSKPQNITPMMPKKVESSLSKSPSKNDGGKLIDSNNCKYTLSSMIVLQYSKRGEGEYCRKNWGLGNYSTVS